MPLIPTLAKPHALTGDLRPALVPGQTAQLIDKTFDTPRALLIIAQSSGMGNLPTWRLRSGLDRSLLADVSFNTPQFSQVIVARTVFLSVIGNHTVGAGTASAVVIELDVSYPAAQLVNAQDTQNGLGVAEANENRSFASSTVAVSVASQLLASANDISYPGVAIYNNSPANRNLYVNINNVASITAGGYIIKIAPGGYYETPFGLIGDIFGIWDGADGAGYANILLSGQI